MGFHGLNLWAVLVAAISAFVLGGLWYAPFLFGGAWKKANGFGANEPPPAGAKIFVISFVSEPGDGTESGDVFERSEDEPGVGRDGWVSCGVWLGGDGDWDCFAV